VLPSTRPVLFWSLSRHSLKYSASSSLAAMTARAADDDRVAVTRGIAYAEVDGKPLLLDLYLPKGVVKPPLVVFIQSLAKL
jgi:hypothetical protein